MRVMAISDLHGYLPNLIGENIDVLLIAGDLIPDGFNPAYYEIISDSNKLYWLRNQFSDWLRETPGRHKVVIAGNHDIPIMKNPNVMRELDIEGYHYLDGETVEIEGIKIHGSPWTPTFGHWAFMKDDPMLVEEWDKIPEDVNILMTHGPAYGLMDLTSPEWGSMHVGSASLRNKIDMGLYPDLKLHVFGHIHPAYGKMTYKDIKFANVSFVDNEYLPVHFPMEFTVDADH